MYGHVYTNIIKALPQPAFLNGVWVAHVMISL